ncbi:TraB/GumN family protein [Winogradskyella sp. PC D3.3]
MNHQIFKDNTSFYLLIVLVFITQFTFAQDNNTYSLLWKIEGNNLETPSYLFGTMHIDDARAFNFSDAVMPAIKSAEYFALGVNPDSLMEAISYIAIVGPINKVTQNTAFKMFDS